MPSDGDVKPAFTEYYEDPTNDYDKGQGQDKIRVDYTLVTNPELFEFVNGLKEHFNKEKDQKGFEEWLNKVRAIDELSPEEKQRIIKICNTEPKKLEDNAS